MLHKVWLWFGEKDPCEHMTLEAVRMQAKAWEKDFFALPMSAEAREEERCYSEAAYLLSEVKELTFGFQEWQLIFDYSHLGEIITFGFIEVIERARLLAPALRVQCLYHTENLKKLANLTVIRDTV